MDLALRWLEAQKEMPSFVASFADNMKNILDAPLPRSLVGEETQQDSRLLASATTPTKPIHDQLIAQGQLYREKRESLREKAIESELKLLTSTPRVTKYPTTQHRNEKIEDRLLRVHRERQERHVYEEEIRSKQQDKDLKKIAPFSPQISAKGKRAAAKVLVQEKQESWHKRREQKLEARRTEKLVRELGEVREGPDLNPRSVKLAAAKREKEGLSGLTHIDAMLERERLSKLALWEKSQRESEAQSNPKITMYAAMLNRSGDVGDRLYQEAMEAEERRLLRMQRSLLEEDTGIHTPKISSLAAAIPRRGVSVEEDILLRHEETRRQMEEDREAKRAQERLSHQPAINPVSSLIASRMPETARERLMKPRSVSRQQSEDPDEPSGLSFVPRTNSRSASTSTAASDHLEALAVFQERKQEHLRKLKEQVEQREVEECTFAPATNKNTLVSTSRLGGGGVGGGSVVDRSHQWILRRKMKLEEQRKALEEKDLVDCTFEPAVHRDPAPRTTAGENVDSGIYGGDGAVWGAPEFIRRQQEARLRREESSMRATTPTSSWSPRVTVPKEFKLGRREGVTPVRSLQKPPVMRLLDESTSVSPAASTSHHQPGRLLPPSMW
jgi:hypothetical protein